MCLYRNKVIQFNLSGKCNNSKDNGGTRHVDNPRLAESTEGDALPLLMMLLLLVCNTLAKSAVIRIILGWRNKTKVKGKRPSKREHWWRVCVYAERRSNGNNLKTTSPKKEKERGASDNKYLTDIHDNWSEFGLQCCCFKVAKRKEKLNGSCIFQQKKMENYPVSWVIQGTFREGHKRRMNWTKSSSNSSRSSSSNQRHRRQRTANERREREKGVFFQKDWIEKIGWKIEPFFCVCVLPLICTALATNQFGRAPLFSRSFPRQNHSPPSTSS